MTLRNSTPAGNPVWTDIMSTDIEASKKFYAALFGWEFEEPSSEEYGGYLSATRNGHLVAGLSPYQPEFGGIPNIWSMYLKSDDIAATEASVQGAGGQVLLPSVHVAPYGHMGIFLDAGGAAFGVWQPQEHQGFGVDSEHGSPAWHELHSKAYPAAVEFYSKAFGWDMHVMSDAPEFRYTTYGQGDDARAGLMDAAGFLPAEVPGFWVTYWGVDDVDAACATAVANGGAVTDGPEDSEFGRVAAITDCCGASLKLVGVQPTQ